MTRPKILFVSSEVFPFAKTGGLADVSASLPKALHELGCDVRIIMPFYKNVYRKAFDLTAEAKKVKHPAVRMAGFDIHSDESLGLKTYFIRHKTYFMRDELYGTEKGDYPDNVLRFSFFSKAVLAAAKALDFKPDVIHCNDWQTALIPFYNKFRFADDKFFKGIRMLYTIHNMAYQGVFEKKYIRRIGMPPAFFSAEQAGLNGNINFMKAGILYADAINTVSRRYAKEIMTPEFGCGLDDLLRSRKKDLYGIPNGVDYSHWSPEKDLFLKVNYNADSVDKKLECKKDLIEYTKLSVPSDKPLLGCVSRLAKQKGMDLIADIVWRLADLGVGIVVLGRGDKEYNTRFRSLQKEYPGNMYYCDEFNDELAHKIEAGCDMFLMPSRYEPCGLNQMYSLKYGTIPVVRATGGLDDAIIDIDEDPQKGNGFKFEEPNAEVFFGTVERAIKLFGKKDAWKELVLRAMSSDFSWKKSAAEYVKLYQKVIERPKAADELIKGGVR